MIKYKKVVVMALRRKKCEEYLISAQKTDRCQFSCEPSYARRKLKIKLLFLQICSEKKAR